MQPLKFLGLIAISLLCQLASAASDTRAACILEMGKAFEQITVEQQQKYLQIDPADGAIRENNQSKFLPGKGSTAYILVHGFASSPFEVEELGKMLQQTGATVYMPLIPGFGSSANVANSYHSADWKNILTSSLEIFSRCFTEVSLLGFSTGGSIVTDFLLNNSALSSDGIYRDKLKIKKASLLSPYFNASSLFAAMLGSAAGNFPSSISIPLLYKIYPSKDLEAFFKNPQYYNQDLPLKAASEVVNFGKELRATALKNNAHSSVPVFVSYSLADETIDIDLIPIFITKHFSDAQFFVYNKDAKIPHQISIPTSNVKISALIIRLMQFFAPSAAIPEIYIVI